MVWGASSWQELTGRFDYFSAGHGTPDDSPEDKTNYSAYSILKTGLGRSPTGDELASGVAAGSGIGSYVQLIKQNDADRKAAADAAAAKKATSSFLSGFAPYAALAPLDLSPADAAAIISLDQTTKSNQLGLTAAARAVNGATVGDSNASMNPVGGAPANPVLTGTKKTGLAVLGLLLLVIYLKRKR